MPTRGARAAAVAGVVGLAAVCAAVAVASPAPVSASVTPGVKPDFVLSPHAPVTKSYTSLLVNDPGPLVNDADDEVHGLVPVPTPDQCRTPAFDVVCDVYRIKLNRSTATDAVNQVVLSMEWTGTLLPDLILVVAGLGIGYVPDLDMFLYAKPDDYLPYGDVGGRSTGIPERIGFVATQDEYDLVIRAGTGFTSAYKLTAFLSDELFEFPSELLDDVAAPPFESSDGTIAPGVPGLVAAPDEPGLALAPIATDAQISGIGLGTTEQFDPQALNLGAQTRAVAATRKPPSTLSLILVMLALPLSVGSGVVLALRRRRHAMVAG